MYAWPTPYLLEAQQFFFLLIFCFRPLFSCGSPQSTVFHQKRRKEKKKNQNDFRTFYCNLGLKPTCCSLFKLVRHNNCFKITLITDRIYGFHKEEKNCFFGILRQLNYECKSTFSYIFVLAKSVFVLGISFK